MSELRDKKARIYVAGHTGLAGSAIVRVLQSSGYTNLITRPHSELDLDDQRAVREFFADEKPEYVFLAAAKVGGILANDTYPAEFIHQNLAIQTNVIHESWRNQVTETFVSRFELHLPKGLSAADQGRVSRYRAAGAHQSCLRHGEDRWP